MNVVDSSGWISYLASERNTSLFAPVIRDIGSLLVPTIVILEVMKWLLPRRASQDVVEAYATMLEASVISLNDTLALEAARLALEHRLSTADSIIFASARAHHATLWTQDRHFEGLEGVRYIAG